MKEKRINVMVIGAHPDDCELCCGGVAAIWSERGHRICFLSVSDGGAGHHEMKREDLVARRAREAKAAARAVGAESLVLPIPDGGVEATLENRAMLIREIRKFEADLIITNRPNDYHPDHRYTSLLVQDSAFMLTVPHIVPDTPALKRNPVILYTWDAFRKPLPFQADVAVSIDKASERKLEALHCHQSQFYEWLPWLDGKLAEVPADEAGRKEMLRLWYHKIKGQVVNSCRQNLLDRYGTERGGSVSDAEAFELCEYGSPLTGSPVENIFEQL